jgi:hypothetical protein
MSDKNIKPLEIRVTTGNSPFSLVFDIFLDINDLYVIKGGSGMNIHSTEIKKGELKFSSTPNVQKYSENPNVVTKKEVSTFVSRQEVYDLIDIYTKSKMAKKIKREVDYKFPESEFGKYIPYSHVFNILFNKYLRDERISQLKRKLKNTS